MPESCHGAFAALALGECGGVRCVVKTLRCDATARDCMDLLREGVLLSKMSSHPNVCRLVARESANEQHPFVAIELAHSAGKRTVLGKISKRSLRESFETPSDV